MCEVLTMGREIGRRDSIVIVAEGAIDRNGNHISSQYVKEVLETRLQEDTRVTILGHVQRGGSPSAFDRNLSTLVGTAAVEACYDDAFKGTAHLFGIKNNKITAVPLEDSLAQTQAIAAAVQAHDFDTAMRLRGSSFVSAFRTVRTLVRAKPHTRLPEQRRLRLAIMNAGAPSPGMNTAVRAAVRLGLDKGHEILGVRHGFRGLVEDDIEEFNWMSVNGWAWRGGAELGTNRHIPQNSDFYAIARNIEKHNIQGLLLIGGWSGYQAVLELFQRRNTFPAFNLPIICMPATIDNDLAGSELSVGADTALNCIVEAVDKIKQSAVASRRVFVVEVMGRQCGYLALMSAMATGAERVYLHEEGITLKDLQLDVERLKRGFQLGQRLGLIIRTEDANETYSTDFVCRLFEEESKDETGEKLFTARQAILGHLQQGGNPMPFDRVLATRFAAQCIEFLEEQSNQEEGFSAAIGLVEGKVKFTDLQDLPRLMDKKHGRPKVQWWMALRPIARIMAQSAPSTQ
jgi:6-phosphofructokinase 1